MFIGVQELNIIMQNMPVMIFYKTVIVGMLCYWMSTRTEKIAYFGIIVAILVFATLNIYHIISLIIIYKTNTTNIYLY